VTFAKQDGADDVIIRQRISRRQTDLTGPTDELVLAARHGTLALHQFWYQLVCSEVKANRRSPI